MKKYFMAGLVILIPVAITFFLVVFLLDFFTEPFLSVVREFLKGLHLNLSPTQTSAIARVGIFFILCLFILFLGMVARWFFFRSLINLGDKILSNIPFIKGIYQLFKDIASALFTTEKRAAFKRASLVPFPHKNSYSIGFETGEIPYACGKKLTSSYTPVVILTAPHPISGYLVFIPNKDIHKIDMTNEEALKFLISCGVIIPESHES